MKPFTPRFVLLAVRLWGCMPDCAIHTHQLVWIHWNSLQCSQSGRMAVPNAWKSKVDSRDQVLARLAFSFQQSDVDHDDHVALNTMHKNVEFWSKSVLSHFGWHFVPIAWPGAKFQWRESTQADVRNSTKFSVSAMSCRCKRNGSTRALNAVFPKLISPKKLVKRLKGIEEMSLSTRHLFDRKPQCYHCLRISCSRQKECKSQFSEARKTISWQQKPLKEMPARNFEVHDAKIWTYRILETWHLNRQNRILETWETWELQALERNSG